MSLHTELAAELADRDVRGLRRVRRLLASPQRARVTVDGSDYVAFCSNDYLGLAADPRLAAAAREGIDRYGVGGGASHLILGHGTAHHELEEALAQFVRLPRALLFSTGYMANMGVVSALTGRGDAVFADKLNHASLNDAALVSRAAFKRYAHNDLEALARLLATTTARRRLVVTDAVFSMDGDIAPVAALLGRIAGRLAGIPMIVYTAHGFYFHEGMPPLRRAVFTLIEWCGARLTSLLFTQSEEDARTAIEKRFLPAARVIAIAFFSAASVCTTRMPRPPPPPAALMITG